MSRPLLLLVPSFTELEWAIKPRLEEWADVATYDTPGVGAETLPESLEVLRDVSEASPPEVLRRWREAVAERGVSEVERRGWHRFVVAADSHGIPSAVRLACARPDAIAGIALGHAALSTSREGDRPVMRAEVLDAFTGLLRTDRDAFLRYGIAQLTGGSVEEERAQQMIERFPDAALIDVLWTALMSHAEQVGDDLRRLDVPLLLAKHEGCLAHTDEGFDDVVAAFPDARTVICHEAPDASPTFAEALREFCVHLDEVTSST
jgi:hypothetical protein